MQAMMWGGAGASLALAALAGWRERRRKRRVDPDAVGAVDWPTVQVMALIALAVLVSLGLQERR